MSGGRVPQLAAAALALAVSACTLPWDHDHLDRLDRVTLTAGDARERNFRIHTVDPIPPKHPFPEATYDGQRTLAVMEQFYERVGVPPQGAGGAAVGAGSAGL